MSHLDNEGSAERTRVASSLLRLQPLLDAVVVESVVAGFNFLAVLVGHHLKANAAFVVLGAITGCCCSCLRSGNTPLSGHDLGDTFQDTGDAETTELAIVVCSESLDVVVCLVVVELWILGDDLDDQLLVGSLRLLLSWLG